MNTSGKLTCLRELKGASLAEDIQEAESALTPGRSPICKGIRGGGINLSSELKFAILENKGLLAAIQSMAKSFQKTV